MLGHIALQARFIHPVGMGDIAVKELLIMGEITGIALKEPRITEELGVTVVQELPTMERGAASRVEPSTDILSITERIFGGIHPIIFPFRFQISLLLWISAPKKPVLSQ